MFNSPIVRSSVKHSLEALFGHKFYIARAARKNIAQDIIAMLRPAKTQRPLIRVGPHSDGGYLVPDDLDGISTCISPGVSDEVGFDFDLAERGMKIVMADASVDAPPIDHPKFSFVKKFIGIESDRDHLSLEELCAYADSDRSEDLMLQMDIEGDEWKVLLATNIETLKRFRILVVEFHDFQQIFCQHSCDFIKSALSKILKTHRVVHVHPNNVHKPARFNGLSVPPVIEITFYRKDRPVHEGTTPILPNPLDSDCDPSKPPLEIGDCWRWD